MDNENGRRGACDRCRGQKLRCVGSGKPTFDSNSRFLRNEMPCDRCKRAKVACYSVRPAPRRPANSDRNLNQQPTNNATPPSSEKSAFSSHHRSTGSSCAKGQVPIGPKPQNDLIFTHTPRSNSVAPHSAQQDGRQSRDPDLLSMPAISNEWIAYLHEDDMEQPDLGLETPPWIESNINNWHDPVADNIEHSMVDLMNQAPSVEWNSDQFDLDLSDHNLADLTNKAPSVEWNSDQFELDPYGDEPPSKMRRLNRGGPAKRSPQMSPQSPDTSKSCLQELAKFNEKLLREKSSFEDISAQKGFKSSRRSTGQTLHHCQEFLSILKGIKYSCPTPDPSVPRPKPDWSFMTEGRLEDGPAQARQGSTTPSISYGSTASSSGRSLSASLSPSLEIPTLLSILFCYTYLLQSYDDLFVSILDAVTRPSPVIPPTLSGLRIDGFELDGHNTLQLECLINVSYNLLEKIETLLIGSTGNGGLLSQSKGGLRGGKLFGDLIDALYEPNDQNGVNGKREVRAKRLIREIQAALKVMEDL